MRRVVGLAAALVLAGCGSLWRPFLEPAAEDNPCSPNPGGALYACADGGTDSDAGPPAPSPWTLEPTNVKNALRAVYTAPAAIAPDQPFSWAVGDGGMVLARDPVTHEWAIPTPVNPALNLTAIHGNSQYEIVTVSDSGRAFRYETNGWYEFAPKLQTAATLQAVWASPLGSFVAAGKSAALFKVNESGWKSISILVSPQPRGPINLTSVWTDGVGNFALTSDDGDIFTLSYADTITRQQISPGVALRSIWGAKPTYLFAVGDQGTVARGSGSGWSIEQVGVIPSTVSLRGVTGRPNGEVWVVGDRGFCAHLNVFGKWERQDTGDPENLNAVFYDNRLQEVIAVGNQGRIYSQQL